MGREEGRDLDTDVERSGNDLVAELEVHEEGFDEVESIAGNLNVDVGVRLAVPQD